MGRRDREGCLWLSDDAEDSETRATVYSSDGALLGHLAIPNAELLEAGADYLLTRRTYDLDRTIIEMYELERPAGVCGF